MMTFAPELHPRGNVMTGHAGQFATKIQTGGEVNLSAPFVTFPAPTVTRFDAEREMREANRKLSTLTMADGARQIVADHPDAATLRVSISHDPDAPGVSQYVDVLDVTGTTIAQQQPFTWAERDPNVLEDMGLVTYWDNDSEGRMTGLVRLPVLSEQVQLIQDGPKVTDDDSDLLRSTRDGRIQVDRLKDRACKADNSAARAYAAESFAHLQEVYPEAETIEMNVYADEDGQGDYVATADNIVYDANGAIIAQDYEGFDLYDTRLSEVLHNDVGEQDGPGGNLRISKTQIAASLRNALVDDRDARGDHTIR